jgi:hypothetical protein
MFLLKQLLPGAIVAALIAGAVLAIAARLGKRDAWMGAVALGLGYTGGHAMTAGWPGLPPADATHWLLYFSLAAMIVGALDAWVSTPNWLRAVVWALFCVGLLFLLLRPKFQNGWSPVSGVAWLGFLATGMVLLAWCWQGISAREGPAAFAPLVAAVVAGGTSVALMLSGSMLLGQFGMALAAALGGSVAVCWFFPDLPFARGAVPVLTALLASLWLSGYFYADLPAFSALLLFLASGAALLPVGGGMSPWKGALLRAGIVLVPVGIAVVVAVRASPPLDY